MKQKTPVILLVLVALFTLFIWFFERRPAVSDADLARRLFPLDRNSISKIELGRPQDGVVLGKSADRWSITAPLKAKADASKVERILSEIEFAKPDEIITHKQQATLAEYGLDKPRLSVTVADKSGSVLLEFGTDTPVGSYVYAKKQGATDVIVVSKNLLAALDKTVDELRDRTVLEFEPYQVSRLEIKTLGQPFEIQKKVNRWQLSRPITARVDAVRVSQLVDALAQPAIEEFVPTGAVDAKSAGFDETAAALTVWTGDAPTGQTLLIGSPVKGKPETTYAKRKNEDTIFTIATELARTLAVQLNDIRDRQLLEFQPRDVTTVEIATPQETVKLALEDNKWRLKAPKETAADASVIAVLLNNLHGLQIREFVEDVVTDLAKFGLDQPAVQITLLRAQPPKPETLPPAPAATGTIAPAVEYETLGKILVGQSDAAKGLLLVKRANEPFVYGVEITFANKLKTSPLAFLDRNMISVSADNIRSLVIERGGQRIAFEKAGDGKWQLAAGQNGVLDPERLTETLHLLASLRAEECVADRLDRLAEFGLDKPEMTVTLEVISPAKTGSPAEAAPQKLELLIGKESSVKRHYALVRGQSVVFEMDSSTYNRLAELFAKTVPPPPPPPPIQETAPPQPAPPQPSAPQETPPVAPQESPAPEPSAPPPAPESPPKDSN